MIKMHLDARWFKAPFTEKDADAILLVITGLHQEHAHLTRRIRVRDSAGKPADTEPRSDAPSAPAGGADA
jgi:hypothetical protein